MLSGRSNILVKRISFLRIDFLLELSILNSNIVMSMRKRVVFVKGKAIRGWCEPGAEACMNRTFKILF